MIVMESKSVKIEWIPVEKLYVSPLNVRADEKFGDSLEDEMLKRNVTETGIKQLITVRPDGKGRYEVLLGRRRFLSIKDKVKTIPCIVREDWDDREAIKASLIENLGIFRKELDPITRAKALKKLVETSPSGLTGVAIELGIPKSTLSEYLKILELSPKLQEKVSKGVVPFRYAVEIARLGLSEEKQEYLAEVSEKKSVEALKKELARLSEGKGKRGAPPGLFVIRLVFDPNNPEEKEYFEKLKQYCESHQLSLSEYVKSCLVERLKSLHA